MKSDSKYNLSHWEKSTYFVESDVLIIGGGIVGVNAAIRLKELKPHWKISILERGIFPYGASTKNAGFACFGSMTELLDDLKTQSEDEVFSLVEKRWRGLQRLRDRVGDQQLEYKTFGAYELFKPEEETTFLACKNHLEHFNQILNNVLKSPGAFEIQDEKIKHFGFSEVTHLINNNLEGQLNPAKMMKTLWSISRNKDIEIYTGIEVDEIENSSKNVKVLCNHGLNFKTSKVLFATNGFTKRLFPDLEVKPARNQVLITKPIPGLSLKGCFHYDKGYFYFRNVGDRVLLGGGRNLSKVAEQTDEFGHTSIIQNALKKLLDTVILPDKYYEIEHWWSGILGIGDQKKPIVKCIDQNVFAAVRLGGMGVAIGTLVGEEAAELIVNT